jgi:coenzyme Q-binding protein COQ10
MSRNEAKCSLAYRPEQIFDLAADVERYPEYLPGCHAARITECDDNVYFSDQIIGFNTFRKRFRTKTFLARPEQIVVTSTDRLFRSFNLTWRFDALPNNGCRVALLIEIELSSKLARELFSRVIVRAVGPIMSAFEARADQLYGPQESQGQAARGSGSGRLPSRHGN